MRPLLRLSVFTVVMLALLAPSPIEAQETDSIELDEWEVPWEETGPRDPHVAPDGKVWFVGQRGHYVAHLDPASGEFTRHDLEDGTGPHNLVVDDDGTVWYTGNRATHIGRVDPMTGSIEKFMMPDERARDPHTLVLEASGDMWFTVQQGNFVGHFDKQTGEAQLVDAPTVEGRGGNPGSSRPYGIKMDSQNRPWITLFNTNAIAMVDPATMELNTYELPEGSRPRRLVVTSDDVIFYVDYAQGELGRLDPSTGEVTEWPSPGGQSSAPYGVTIDADDRVWYVEGGVNPNQFVGFDPASEEFFSVTPMTPGGGTVRHMYYDADHNVVWYGTDRNTIGRANLPALRRAVS